MTSKVINAHAESIKQTIASLEDEKLRIDSELRVFRSALKLFGIDKPDKLGKTQQIAYDLLKRKQVVVVADVAKAADISDQAAGQALHKLVNRKLAKRKGRGLYTRRL